MTANDERYAGQVIPDAGNHARQYSTDAVCDSGGIPITDSCLLQSDYSGGTAGNGGLDRIASASGVVSSAYMCAAVNVLMFFRWSIYYFTGLTLAIFSWENDDANEPYCGRAIASEALGRPCSGFNYDTHLDNVATSNSSIDTVGMKTRSGTAELPLRGQVIYSILRCYKVLSQLSNINDISQVDAVANNYC